MAAQFTGTKGWSFRADQACSADATRSFPLPVSPQMRTGISVTASRSTSSYTRSIAGSATIALRSPIWKVWNSVSAWASFPGAAPAAALRARARRPSTSEPSEGQTATPALPPTARPASSPRILATATRAPSPSVSGRRKRSPSSPSQVARSMSRR